MASAPNGDVEHAENSYELKPIRQTSNDSSRHDDESPVDSDDDDLDTLDAMSPAIRESSVSTAHSFELYTPDEERAVVKKLDTRVVLFMSFLYLLAFLDRSNIGNAKIAGLDRDLQLEGTQFDWLLTAFYITYISFEWMILLYNYLPPHIYIGLTVLAWGLIASMQAVATSFTFMLILRLLLGLSEAAFSPGVPFYLSFFYRRDELAFRAGIQISAAPLAASFAGSLAYVITKLGERSPFAPWRLLFLIEGFPTVVVAAFAWNLVPDSPGTAWFLTARQRKIAKLRLRNEVSDGKDQTGSNLPKKVDWREILETLADAKCYLTALMFLNCNIAFSSMPVFLPTVIHEMGYSSINSQALSAPPFLVAFVVLLLTAKLSDRLKARSLFVCLHALLAFSGYALIALGGWLEWSHTIRYLCVYPAAAGFFSAITIIITWTMNNQESNAKRGTGMTMLNLIGQCGPLVGTRLYPDRDKPYYVTGMTVCAAAMLVVFFLSLILRFILIRENRRRATVAEKDDHDELLAEGKRGASRREHFVLML